MNVITIFEALYLYYNLTFLYLIVCTEINIDCFSYLDKSRNLNNNFPVF